MRKNPCSPQVKTREGKMRLRFPAVFFREGDVIVSLCPVLNVSSFGETEEGAERSLIEAVAAFIRGCNELGTLEEVLEESGYRRENEVWVAPSFIGMREPEVAVA
jgi:predicted RNase H-like HicB family nuclease